MMPIKLPCQMFCLHLNLLSICGAIPLQVFVIIHVVALAHYMKRMLTVKAFRMAGAIWYQSASTHDYLLSILSFYICQLLSSFFVHYKARSVLGIAFTAQKTHHRNCDLYAWGPLDGDNVLVETVNWIYRVEGRLPSLKTTNIWVPKIFSKSCCLKMGIALSACLRKTSSNSLPKE